MHAYAKEVESKAKAEKENRVDSLRNYYMDQLALLEEELNERARTSKMQDKVGSRAHFGGRGVKRCARAPVTSALSLNIRWHTTSFPILSGDERNAASCKNALARPDEGGYPAALGRCQSRRGTGVAA
jgi:hypothetical protein